MKHHVSIVVAAGIAMSLAACSVPPSVPTPNVSPLQSPLVVSTEKPVTFPTPILPTPVSTDKATVGGVILREIDGQPLQGLTSGQLFLGQVYRDANDRPMMAGLDKTKAPATLVMDNGQFMFKEVPIGTYALIFDNPAVGALVLKNPKTGEDLLIEVKKAEVINLGELRYPFPY